MYAEQATIESKTGAGDTSYKATAENAGRLTAPDRKRPDLHPLESGRPRRGEFFRRKPGILPKKFVRTAAFGVISLSIFACGALCLLAVWDYATAGVPWRAISSLGIIAGTMGAFAFVNEFFSEAEAQADHALVTPTPGVT